MIWGGNPRLGWDGTSTQNGGNDTQGCSGHEARWRTQHLYFHLPHITFLETRDPTPDFHRLGNGAGVVRAGGWGQTMKPQTPQWAQKCRFPGRLPHVAMTTVPGGFSLLQSVELFSPWHLFLRPSPVPGIFRRRRMPAFKDPLLPSPAWAVGGELELGSYSQDPCLVISLLVLLDSSGRAVGQEPLTPLPGPLSPAWECAI